MRLAGVFILTAALMVTRVPAQEIAAPSLQLAPVQNRLSTASKVWVRRFRFEGNTAFSEGELSKIVAPFLGRPLLREELDDARRAVTLHYVHHGYINSGAVLPDQPVTDGVVTIRIIEGRVTAIHLTGNHWLRDGFITDRVNRWVGPPVNLNELQDGLQLLRQNHNIEQVNAELRPGNKPGEGVLDLRVKEPQPFRVGLQIDNHRPPSVHSMEILLTAADLNLTGNSDPLSVMYGIAEGGMNGFEFSDLKNMGATYTLPFTQYDTTLQLFGNRSDYAVVEEPFRPLNINSSTVRYGAKVRQPFWQGNNHEIAISAGFDREESSSFNLGKPYDFPESGSVNGRTAVSVLRLSQEWTDRRLNHVAVIRSTFNVGVDAFGVTDDGSDRTSKFFSWQGQGQYARRLWNTSNQIVLRAAGQWTQDQLLPIEQFSVGGANSVRGYRENQLVRDRGMFASAELHLPVLYDKKGSPLIQLVPFYDFGGGWDMVASPVYPFGSSSILTGSSRQVTTISSAGIGILITPCKQVSAELFWGHPFRRVDSPHDDPQDLGLSFRVNIEAF